MNRKLLLLLSLLVILFGANLTFAQAKKNDAPKIKGSQAEITALITFAEQRFVSLAEAFPEEKYSWKPGKGVRSFGEVLSHMVQANYGLPGVVGAKPPGDAPKDVSKITDKKELISHLKKSFEHTRSVVKGMSTSDLDKDVKFFGNDTTYRAVLNFMNVHTNQHLGQLIAYARMNDVAPPWSAANN